MSRTNFDGCDDICCVCLYVQQYDTSQNHVSFAVFGSLTNGVSGPNVSTVTMFVVVCCRSFRENDTGERNKIQQYFGSICIRLFNAAVG